MVNAKRYKINVTEGPFAMTHGITHTITEFFVPRKNFCFNIGDGNLNVIYPQASPRDGAKDIQDVQLPDKLVVALEKWMKARHILIREVKLLIG